MGSILVLGGVGFTVKEVVETARKVTGHPIPAKEEPRRAGDPSMLIASSAKAREVLGWNPQYADLETIIGFIYTIVCSVSQITTAARS